MLAALNNEEARMTNDEGMTKPESRILVGAGGSARVSRAGVGVAPKQAFLRGPLVI
jgi:hypothetical protein